MPGDRLGRRRGWEDPRAGDLGAALAAREQAALGRRVIKAAEQRSARLRYPARGGDCNFNGSVALTGGS